MTGSFKSIARSIHRLGARDRLRGRALFGADIPLARPVTLRVYRSQRPHARIVRLNVDRARALPGVAGVFTAADVPGKNLFGLITKDQPLLAQDRVRFVGDALALVAAETSEEAEAALAAIEVEYEDLPAVFDPAQSLMADATPIHDRGNLLYRQVVRKGDVEEAFARCQVVVERTYETAHVEHNTLEPDAGVGYLDGDGSYVICASTQNPHYDQKEVAGLLAVGEDRVRVVQAATGGGCGSKLDLTVQGFIGLALLHLRRPVRLVYGREEVYLATSKRHPLRIQMKTGADGHGRLLAMKARILGDTGAYASYGVAVATRAAIHATGPYEVPNVDAESLCVYTNNPVAGAMRGFGVPQVAFAHESQMDLLAEALGMDPFEIRRINALRPGASTATGQSLQHSVGILKTLERLQPHYLEAQRGWKGESGQRFRRRGVGIGAMWYGIGNTGVQNPSTARVEMGPDGQVTLFTGTADMGQGSTTVLAQIASEVLGLDPEELRLVVADTRQTTNAGASSASRQTYISGNAVREAAQRLGDVLMTEAVDVLKVPREGIRLGDGLAVDGADHTRNVPFAVLAKRASRKGIPLTWQGYFDPETTPLDPDTGQGIPYATYAFACHLALVEVDVLCGEVRVERIVAVHDVGKAIHPEGVVGQIRGGVAMGLGFALMEEFVPGTTHSMKDYPIPTCADMPRILPIIVEDPEPTGPFGAKGVGEPALIPTAPAILNAIADALGGRLYRLPASLERVLAASVRAGHFGPKVDK